MIKIAVIGIGAAGIAMLVREVKQGVGVMCTLATAVCIFALALPYYKDIIAFFHTLSSEANLDAGVPTSILKTVGIAFVTEFAADFCSDAGQASIGSKVQMAGKGAILVSSVPLLQDLLRIASSLVG